MRKLSSYLMAVSLVFSTTALGLYAQPEQPNANNPPVSQPLVAEGTFALKLASALKLGAPTSEDQAEDILAKAGIAPKNGWIADYPMTPIIIGQVQYSIASVAGTDKLPMQKADALKVFQDLTDEYGLAVMPASGQNTGPYGNLPEGEIDNYYYNQGPPAVTYYPPPWEYGYLYNWVPYPFYGGSFFFPGFFVLNDFAFFGHDRLFFHNRFFFHDHFFTNHFFDSRNHAFVRINPNSRFTHGSIGFVPDRNRSSSAQFRTGSRAIFGRESMNGFGFAHNPAFTGTPNMGSRSFAGRSMTSRNFGRSFGMQPGMGSNRSGSFGGFHSGGSGGFRGGGFHGGGFGGHGGGFGGHGGGGHR